MSEPPSSVSSTITGGIQDIAALLPILGTDQCESHVGSALEGGYLYAAASPLSIFGSLGIVKLGVTVLISTISIPKLSVSFKLKPHPKLSMTFRKQRFLGSRILGNAGFKPVGSVASLIAMDGKRHRAETRLLEIIKVLEEKHIDDANNLIVEWKSAEWNLILVACTTVAAVVGITPYIPLTSRPFRRSVSLYSPWIFPLLRTVGSCLAVVSCQFLLQLRIVSLMKNRIIFMSMNHNKALGILTQSDIQWDASLPSEECLWSLNQHLQSIQVDSEAPHISETRRKLLDLHNEHSISPFYHAFGFIFWIILFLSLPATVAGYIGCFTLVSGSQGNGPLVWLGLEAALSIIRILLWASNPKFDEATDVTVRLNLVDDQPLVTTEKCVEVIKDTRILPLLPERQFFERIGSYTGPQEQFQSSENLLLYFTLTGNLDGKKQLFLTVSDDYRKIAVTLHRREERTTYTEAVVTYNEISSEMEAAVQSEIGKDSAWKKTHAILLKELSDYYLSILRALNRSHSQPTTRDESPSHLDTLTRYFRAPTANVGIQIWTYKWNLPLASKHTESNSGTPASNSMLTEQDRSYLQRGTEHDLKTKLVDWLGQWIVRSISCMTKDAQRDCRFFSNHRKGDEEKWELMELDRLLAIEWTRREWSLLVLSFHLEIVLHRRMGEFVQQLVNERLREWVLSEFVLEQRKRTEKERKRMKERMEEAMKTSAQSPESEGQAWIWRDQAVPGSPIWHRGQEFIDEQWRAGWEAGWGAASKDSKGVRAALALAETRLNELVEDKFPDFVFQPDPIQRSFKEQVRPRFKHWQSQRKNERRAMDAIIDRISPGGDDLTNLYDPKKCCKRWTSAAFHRFVVLKQEGVNAKISSAIVYDVKGCSKEEILDAIQNGATRSVINVDPGLDLFDPIRENHHLLHLGREGHSHKPPAFIQQNRDQWWKLRTGNWSRFYFSPKTIEYGQEHVFSNWGTIAHISIFLQPDTQLRLRLLHFQRGKYTLVSIKEDSKLLYAITEIPKELGLQDIEFPLNAGAHKLELVVDQSVKIYGPGSVDNGEGYGLRDIFVEFVRPTQPLSSHVNPMAGNLEEGKGDEGGMNILG